MASQPPRGRPLADPGSLGRRRQRPPLINNTTTEQQPRIAGRSGRYRAASSVSSLDWGLRQPPASKEARMNHLLRNYIEGACRRCRLGCSTPVARRQYVELADRVPVHLLEVNDDEVHER